MITTRKTIKKIQFTEEECIAINKTADILTELANEVSPKMDKLLRLIDTSTDDYETANGNDLHAAAIFLDMLTEYDTIEIEE